MLSTKAFQKQKQITFSLRYSLLPKTWLRHLTSSGAYSPPSRDSWLESVASIQDRKQYILENQATLKNDYYFSEIVPELTARISISPNKRDQESYSVKDAGMVFDFALEELITGKGYPAETAMDFIRVGGSCKFSYALAIICHLFGYSTPPVGSEKLIQPLVKKMQEASISGHDYLKNPNTDRHAKAILALVEHNPSLACSLWENALLVNPWDILAIMCLQETYLRFGKKKSALECVERVLSSWEPSTPNFSRLLAFHAVGLVENGHALDGEEVAGRSLSLDLENGFAVRAVARSMARTSRFREGLRLLRELGESFEDEQSSLPNWRIAPELNLFRCVYEIECGKVENAISVLDERLINVPLLSDNEMGSRSLEHKRFLGVFLNAVSALWRLHIVGVDEQHFENSKQSIQNQSSSWLRFGKMKRRSEMEEAYHTLKTRFEQILAKTLGLSGDVDRATLELQIKESGFLNAEIFYPIVNIYKTIALVGAGEFDSATKFIESLENLSYQEKDTEYSRHSPGDSCGSPYWLLSNVVAPICRAVLLLEQGAYSSATELLLARRANFSDVGGTFEHVDLLDQTLIHASLKAAQVSTTFSIPAVPLVTTGDRPGCEEAAEREHRFWTSRALVLERSIRLASSPQAWRWRWRIFNAMGNEPLAQEANSRSLDLGFRQGS